MSKLREKFIPHCDNVVMDKEVNAEFCEQITDDFAIKFAEWRDNYRNELNEWKINNVKGFDYSNKTTTELLQIFKDKYYL